MPSTTSDEPAAALGSTVIVFFLPNLQMGGAETMTVSLANWMADRSPSECLVGLHVLSPAFDSLRAHDCSSAIVRYEGVAGYLRLLGTLHRHRGPVTLVAATETYPVLLTFCARMLLPRARLILWLHTDPTAYFARHLWFGRLFKFIARRSTTTVVCVSESVADRLRTFLGGHDHRAEVIRNAIEPQQADAIRSACHARGARENRIGFVGRVSSEKGIELLFRAFRRAEIAAAAPPLTLSIFTDQAGAEQIAEEVSSIARCEVVVGRSKDGIYSSIGTIVIASRFEGFSLVCLEAMMGGLTIIYRSGLSAVEELLDVARYPKRLRFSFATEAELASLLAGAAREPTDHEELIAVCAALGFDAFTARWAEVVGGGAPARLLPIDR